MNECLVLISRVDKIIGQRKEIRSIVDVSSVSPSSKQIQLEDKRKTIFSFLHPLSRASSFKFSLDHCAVYVHWDWLQYSAFYLGVVKPTPK